MPDQKNKRSILNVLKSNVPGSKELVLMLSFVMLTFLLIVSLSTWMFFKSLRIEQFVNAGGDFVLNENIKYIFIFWALAAVILFIYSVYTILKISYFVAGPIKRIERILDDMINGKDVSITLRPEDALAPVANKINLLVEMLKKKTPS